MVTSGLALQGRSAVLPVSLSMSLTLWTLPFIALATSAVPMPPAAGLWHVHAGDQGPWAFYFWC